MDENVAAWVVQPPYCTKKLDARAYCPARAKMPRWVNIISPFCSSPVGARLLLDEDTKGKRNKTVFFSRLMIAQLPIE
jgi:hypothetical protein